ncbi:MAG: hypothetical protein ABSB80_02265 [Methanoregula sp.]|uniref:hypothetical protein n=1 Tax=Methanoregula sp. TaxID=2052170 RepID=UPI003D0B2816
MTKFKLIPYALHIKKIDSGDNLRLDDLNGEKSKLEEKLKKRNHIDQTTIKSILDEIENLKKTNDLFYILQDFIKSRGITTIFPDDQKTISIERYEPLNRDIFGIIKSGEYGLSADFFNIEDKSYKPDARGINDSEVFPFFFHFRIPENSVDGKIILQTVRTFGVTVALQKYLNEYLKKYNYSIVFRRIVSKDFVGVIRSSRLVELELIKKTVDKDTAEKIHKGEFKELRQKVIFGVAKNKTLILTEKIEEMLGNKGAVNYEVLDETYDAIKAVIKQKGSSRTITFGMGEGKVGEEWILDNNIPKEKGHPTYNALLDISKECMNILNQEIDEISEEKKKHDSTH